MKTKQLIILFILLFCTNPASFAVYRMYNTTAIGAAGCAEVNSRQAFLLIVPKKHSITAELLKCVENAKINTASVQGIGSVKDIDIGYFNTTKHDYIHKKFNNEDFELLSLLGDISLKDNKPFAHLHVILGNNNYQTIGGHLFSAKVAVTAELLIAPLIGNPAVRDIEMQLISNSENK